MPKPQSVLITAIFLSLNLDFKTNYIFGADSSWHEELYVDNDNDVYFTDKNFYDNNRQEKIKSYQDNTQTQTVKDFFYRIMVLFECYEELAKYSEKKGAIIYNVSLKSYIDAFKRFKIS